MPRLTSDSRRWFWPLIVVLSLLINLLQVPILHGSFGALVVAVLTQVYLPGYLLARRLGRHRLPHPIHRFGWVLACGLGLSIVMGGIFRLLEQPIPIYLSALHVVLLLLALWPAGSPPSEISPWQWTWKLLPLYGLVIFSCGVVFWVSHESRYRFYLFDDRSLFTSFIDWLAHHPGERPVSETPLRSRQIGVISADSRMDTDGWTYNQAAWSWSSGVSGAEIIWYNLATLFLWAVPLISFALAYELTRDERMAAFSAAALTLVGLLTLDNLVYFPSYIALGRWTVFQINVVRQASLTLLLPLALLCGFAYLSHGARRDLIPMALTTVALALMHPIQFMILAISVGATGLAELLRIPTRQTLQKLLPIALVFGMTMGLPYLQRSIRIAGISEEVLTVVRPDTITNPNSMANLYFKVLSEIPILGETYIRDPQTVFYHPAITLSVIIALIYGLCWRSSQARQYVFSVTAVALLLFFTPGLTRLFDRIVSSVGVLTAMFLLPVALSYGLAVGDGLRFLKNKWSRLFNEHILYWSVSTLAVAVMLALLVEPLPIPASARDQLNAFNAIQESQRMHPSQADASALLLSQIPAGRVSIIAAPQDMSGFVVEDSPDTLITGGRRNANRANAANNRFFNEGDSRSPWLDAIDLEFLNQWGVNYVLGFSDWTRLAQIQLQPDRFESLGTVGGYVVYRITAPLVADDIDRLYSRMNERYAEGSPSRWGREGFNLALPGSPDIWEPFIAEWRTLIRQNPLDKRAWLGLAFAQTMAGDDISAAMTWQELYTSGPDTPLYADALATSRAAINAAEILAPLTDGLESSVDYRRVLAARRLITEPFFYRLDESSLGRILSVIERDAVTWDRLANFDQPESVRARSTLMLYRGDWQRGLEWLRTIPRVRLAPEDLVAMAAVQLAVGDLDGALGILEPATDADWVRANTVVHPDRWLENPAANMFHQLDQDRQLPPDTLPESHPLRLLNAPSVYVFDASVTQSEDDQSLLVTASFGDYRPRAAFPIQTWRVYVVSADGLTEYARVDTQAVFPDGPLTRATLEVPLPPGIPLLTSAQVIIEPRYNNAVTVTPLRQHIVLNRPAAVDLPASTPPEQAQFGGVISLRGTSVQAADEALTVDLYWQADSLVSEDYQIFIHVFDAAGNRVVQRDSGPVDGRYPTSQWRMDTLIVDSHLLGLDQPLTAGDYTVRIGLYRLSDGTRLPITGADERVQDNSLLIGTFSR